MDTESDQKPQVPVLRGQRGDDDAKAQAQKGHHQNEDRGEQNARARMKNRSLQGVESHESQKKSELYAESDQIRQHDRDRHDQPREVDFTENGGIVDECGRRFIETFREIVPHHGSGQVEQNRRQAVGRNLRDSAEHDREHEGRQNGLDEEPQRPENGLLVV